MSYGEELGGLGGYGGYTSLALRDPAMAAALRKQQMGLEMATSWKPQGPVLSPWQGVDALVKGLMGGYLANQGGSELKDQAEKQNAEASDFKNNMSQLLMGGQPQAPTPQAPTPQASSMGAALSGQPQPQPQAPGNLQPIIDQAADAHGIPRPLAYAMFKQESQNGQASPNIGQVTQGTAANPGFGMAPLAPQDINTPEKNIPWSLQYLKARGDAAGVKDWNDPQQQALALKGYNGGGDPNYVQNVTRYMPDGGANARGTQYAGPGVPQDQAPQAPASPDPEAMMARAAQIRQAALQASQHNNPGIRSQAAYMEHYADSLERQAQALQARTDRRNDRQDAYTQRQADKRDAADLAAANRVPQHVIMKDEDGKGNGIYELTPQGRGRRLGDAPNQPGKEAPWEMSTLVDLAPSYADGTATPEKRRTYELAYQTVQNGKMQWVPDPSDPTGQKQQMVQVPGAVPEGFPVPGGKPGGAAAASGAPTKTTTAPEADRQAAGYYLRMQEASKSLDSMEQKGIHTGNRMSSIANSIPGIGHNLAPSDFQVYQQQAQDWVRAKLRKESGAAIGDKEMQDEIKTYFPQPGEPPEVVAAKQRSRQIAEAGMKAQAGKSVVEAPAMPQAPAGPPAPPPGFRIVR